MNDCTERSGGRAHPNGRRGVSDWLGKARPGPIRDSAGDAIKGETVPARLWRDFTRDALWLGAHAEGRRSVSDCGWAHANGRRGVSDCGRARTPKGGVA
ncbi:hypothetical protein [Actinoplanes sp. NPDC049118]|uniref:hypothetical protein n=1 Tax=Actinoplanes sp. NPDC049118 TaxID=3155769 RepID=UPI003404465D